ncbi:MAG: hypothetical protein ACI8RZ_002529 [Myxococcota bacterium]|jgi:hypothetical protein
MTRTLLIALLGTLIIGCGDKDEETADVDIDGDGSTADADCDDADATAYPGNTESCDGVDNDCDGDIDNGVLLTLYSDSDGDGYGDAAASSEGCEAGAGLVEDATDCDDSDAAYNPGAAEDDCTDPADYNCDGAVEYADADADGFAACVECDDTNADIHPDADEVCDGFDNDCDDLIDAADDSVLDASTFYADWDGDGFGDPKATTAACVQPKDYSADSTDCDDTSAAIYPGAEEICDGADSNCDSFIDEAIVPTDYASIQGAIDSGEPWICVEPGTYAELIDFGGNDIVVESVEGPQTTTIDGAGTGPVVSFINGESSAAILRGFTVTGGYMESTGGAGVYMSYSTPTLDDLIITGNEVTSGYGGGLYAYYADFTLSNSTISDNTSEFGSSNSYGGGALIWYSDVLFDNVTVEGNSITANYPWGGGLALYQSTTMLLNLSVLNNTTDTGTGGQHIGTGLMAYGGTTHITNAIFAGNFSNDSSGTSTDYGSAIFSYSSNVLTLENATFTGNETNAAYVYGQAVTIYSATATAVNVDASNNIVDKSVGTLYGDAFGCSGGTLSISYSNLYGETKSTGTSACDSTTMTNMLSVDPLYTDTSAPNPANWDLTLSSTSPLIDAGAPAILDADKTVSDIGAYGGPDGDSW